MTDYFYHECDPDCWDCGVIGEVAMCEDGRRRCRTCEARAAIEAASAAALPEEP